MSIHTYLYMSICILYACLLHYASVYTHVYTHVYIRVYTHVYAQFYTHVYTHIYTHIYTHVHIHVYTHVYTQVYARVYRSVRGCEKIINSSLKFVQAHFDGNSLILIREIDDFGDETVGGRIFDFQNLKMD